MAENKPYYELSPAEFIPWLVNFITVMTANKVVLGVTEAQIEALQNWLTTLQAALNAQVAAEKALEAAGITLGEQHAGSKTAISFYNTTFKANKSIPRALIEELGLQVSEGRDFSPPTVPLDLIVKPDADGTNYLKCKRNGNKPNTIFVWEYQIEGATDWKYLASTSETKFAHADRTPGEEIAYRVKATRAGQESAYSTVAVAYFKE